MRTTFKCLICLVLEQVIVLNRTFDCVRVVWNRTSARLVRDHGLIVIEDLAVKNMVRNGPLAKAIADCGWGTFRRMIEYKAAGAGRQLIVIDRWYPSSKACGSPGRGVVDVPRLTHIITSPGGIACVRSVLIRVRRSAR